MNTSVSAAATASTTTMSLACALPSINPRDAVASVEIGLTLTKASSGPGSVVGSTNTLDRKVSGKIAMNPLFITALGLRSSRPSTEKTQDRPNEKSTTRASAATTPATPAPG